MRENQSFVAHFDTNGTANGCAICYSIRMVTETQMDYYERINQIQQYIRDHLDGPLDRDALARLIGCCRNFSLLACAILRHQGRAARVRHGFGNYFVPEYWFDHVIVEVWEEERWCRFDPQLALDHNWGFNTLDMPADVFATGGRAWQLCRAEQADPARFGLGPNEQAVRGWWFIREQLQLDVAALNKVELLCWDSIEGVSERVPADTAILDKMAALSLEPDSTLLRQRCATDPRWQLPTSVSCFHPMLGPAFAVEVA